MDDGRPQSCVPFWEPALILGAISVIIPMMANQTAISVEMVTLALVLIVIAPLGMFEWHRAASADKSTKTMFFVVAETAVALSLLALLYWLLPEYRHPYYAPFFALVRWVMPWVAAAAALTLIVGWLRSADAQGASTQEQLAKPISCQQWVLAWLVRGFFLPLMICDLTGHVGELRHFMSNVAAWSWSHLSHAATRVALVAELAFVCAGYLGVSRALGTHIRRVESSLAAWVVTVACYRPFLHFFLSHYLDYQTDIQYDDWLAAQSIVAAIWTGLVVACFVTHAAADAALGLRFSNLTDRGIVTGGPFRFTKHPAYLIKNLRWWLVSVPFAGGVDLLDSLRLSLLLLGVNVVYVARAYYEERFLSADPTYRAYALWIDRNGLLAPIGRLVPQLTFEWRYARWTSAAAKMP
jgi:protein-S-isoprenylcysteine O-methyltransferase Ste14